LDILRKAFADITVGATHAVILGNRAWIKHLSYADQINQDSIRDGYFEEAKRQGIATNEERMVQLRQEKLWSDEREKEIETTRRMINGLIEGKKKHSAMPSMVKGLLKQQKDEEKKMTDLLVKKEQLLGLTCESYADHEVSDFYICSNLFLDRDLKVNLWTDEEFEYLSNEAVQQVIQDYNTAIEGCSDLNLKRLAMQPFFQSYFGLTGENMSQFFGKPICHLTFYQVRLLSYGIMFRNVYQTTDVSKFPKNVMDDPDLLLDYSSAAKQSKAELEKQGGYDEGAMVVGMKKEDAQVLGVRNQTSVIKDMVKGGGNVIDWATKRG